jgi:hypothetical protein
MKKLRLAGAMMVALMMATPALAIGPVTKKVTAVRAYVNGNVFVFVEDMPECSNRVLVRAGPNAQAQGVLSVALAAYLSGRQVRFEYTGSGADCVLAYLDVVP